MYIRPGTAAPAVRCLLYYFDVLNGRQEGEPPMSQELKPSRRDFLKKGVASGIALKMLPFEFLRTVQAAERPLKIDYTTRPDPKDPVFFTPAERVYLARTANYIMDGAADLGAVEYIEQLLTAFEYQPHPRIYATGPFLGRQPVWELAAKTPGGAAAFQAIRSRRTDVERTFLPLTRAQEIAWRLRIYGPRHPEVRKLLPYGAPREKFLKKPLIGLRDLFRYGTHDPREIGTLRFECHTPDEIRRMHADLKHLYHQTVITLVMEGCFGAPEYGGNLDGQGWRLADFHGDFQPVGYTRWTGDVEHGHIEQFPGIEVSMQVLESGDRRMPQTPAQQAEWKGRQGVRVTELVDLEPDPHPLTASSKLFDWLASIFNHGS